MSDWFWAIWLTLTIALVAFHIFVKYRARLLDEYTLIRETQFSIYMRCYNYTRRCEKQRADYFLSLRNAVQQKGIPGFRE